MTVQRIAVTGTHGTGKTYIKEQVKKHCEKEFIPFSAVESPTRYVKSLGFGINGQTEEPWKTEYLCVGLRVERELRALETHRKMFEDSVIFGDRCVFDEFSYSKLFYEQNPTEELWSLLDLMEKWCEDACNYWDVIALKGKHPDHDPIADGDRLPDLSFQSAVGRKMEETFEQFRNVGSAKKVILPLDRDEAASELKRLITAEKVT